MLIYDILKMDHRMIINIIDAISTVKESNRRKHMLMLVDTELTMHHKAEETVFYNTLRHFLPDEEMLRASFDEHDKIDSTLATLQFSPADNSEWIATLGTLRTMLQQHMMKEETALFTLAQKQFTTEEALEMGMHLLEEKGKLGMSNLFMVTSHKTKELAADS